MKPMLLYTTFPNTQAAHDCARRLLDGQLIACANIMPPGQSLYRWEGQIEETTEVVMFLKTTEARYPEVTEAIYAAHPYETPCILALEIVDGLPKFLNWIVRETARPAP